MFFIARNWRLPKLVIAFFIVEFAFTIPALILYALADPDEYRTALWTDGAANGFNSSPMTALYEAANYRPVHIPLVWQPFVTHYNIVASVLITFLLLVKAIMFTLHIWVPLLSFIVHATCTCLFAYSARVQSLPDLSDPKHLQPGVPWYIGKSCSVAHYQVNVNYCKQAKAAFAITVLLTIIFGINTVWAAYCIWPTKEEREQRRLLEEEDEEVEILEKWSPEADEQIYEMRQWPASPQMPNSPWLNTSSFGHTEAGKKTSSIGHRIVSLGKGKGKGQEKGASSEAREMDGDGEGGSYFSDNVGRANQELKYPDTPKGPNALPLDPVTPRTFAFRRLGGS